MNRSELKVFYSYFFETLCMLYCFSVLPKKNLIRISPIIHPQFFRKVLENISYTFPRKLFLGLSEDLRFFPTNPPTISWKFPHSNFRRLDQNLSLILCQKAFFNFCESPVCLYPDAGINAPDRWGRWSMFHNAANQIQDFQCKHLVEQ